MPLHLLVSQAALQDTEKKTAESPLLARDAPQRFVLKKVLEKGLSQVLRGVCVVAAAPEVGVDWSPIDAAYLCQRCLCARLGRCTRGDNNAPRRRLKTFPAGFRYCRVEHAAILHHNPGSCQACRRHPRTLRRGCLLG